MKSFIKSYGYLLLPSLFLTVFLASDQALARQETQAFDSSIIVLAPTSMTNAMHEIMKTFSNNINISVSGSFESSSEISRLILEGEPANIYITDDTTQMRDLQRIGVLNLSSVSNIASDKLVLVIPTNNFLKKKLDGIKSTEEKLNFVAKNVSLVIPDPDSEPCGRSIKQAFEKIGLWDQVSKKMLKAANTRNGLYLIANGNNAGIIYSSDTIYNPDVEVLLEIPQEHYDKITYQASIVAELDTDTNNSDSKKFMDFLKTDEVREIFTKYGFTSI